jgi:hypothetical protein
MPDLTKQTASYCHVSRSRAGYGVRGIWSWNGHAIKILRPVRRIVRRAIVPPGPREKRHLPDLWVTGGRRDCLDSDDLLLFARGVGRTLPKLLNVAFVLPAFKKNPQLL